MPAKRKKAKVRKAKAVRKPRLNGSIPTQIGGRTVVVATKSTLPHLMLLDPHGAILVAYKVITDKGLPPIKAAFTNVKYEIGKTYSMSMFEVNRDRFLDCGKGYHVATKNWCETFWASKERRRGKKLCLVSVSPKDIAVVPVRRTLDTFGSYEEKFRVSTFTILKQVPWGPTR